MPPSLAELYEAENLPLMLQQLVWKGKGVMQSMNISKEQAHIIEHQTKAQAGCRQWFLQRAGKITASNYKAAVETNPSNPSVSLVKTEAMLPTVLSQRLQGKIKANISH
ncbi:hypothetical protein HOLleu_03072 [Holothuria leucospilota]|uniref:Uncharacterized protein n=1 Tax=Holothuria leucospilota TaxID=206669 RepID=A0A9Q1HL65_HOLLE|nr:hypothetical protein HOLleu_03072 [Holothuria leucospilota]